MRFTVSSTLPRFFMLVFPALAVALTAATSQIVTNTPVYSPGDGGKTCFRIPSLVAVGDVLYAFAEARSNAGDGCFPIKPVKGDGRTSIVFRTSTNGGLTWNPGFTDICPKAPGCE